MTIGLEKNACRLKQQLRATFQKAEDPFLRGSGKNVWGLPEARDHGGDHVKRITLGADGSFAKETSGEAKGYT